MRFTSFVLVDEVSDGDFIISIEYKKVVNKDPFISIIFVRRGGFSSQGRYNLPLDVTGLLKNLRDELLGPREKLNLEQTDSLLELFENKLKEMSAQEMCFVLNFLANQADNSPKD